MKQIRCDALVIGSGAAGLSAAYRLKQNGIDHVIVLTDARHHGTSRNTGSDKQTYYKLNLCGSDPDSVVDMATDIFNGGACDGDSALAEAASSARCYYQLLELGVPFVLNEIGESCGYLTDHGRGQRATSAGPLTSKYMTEQLDAAAERAGVHYHEGYYAHTLIQDSNTCYGVIAMDKASQTDCAFISQHTIIATGGPALVYSKSVFPNSQIGGMALAVKAGVTMQNLTEWQFGIASVKFRWNLSGSYQQALPRYYAVDDTGIEHDFLRDAFEDMGDMINSIFLKGYQWPFDARKALNGSSRIDLLVHEQLALGRRVYMDFTRNPWDGMLSHDEAIQLFSDECRDYLQSTHSLCPTPIERLLAINTLAYDLYRSHDIDLATEPLEIQVSSQHMNGGIGVDSNWQTSMCNLYAIGEAAGTHGVYRPGGSALNAGQVGALRAARHIAQTHPQTTVLHPDDINILIHILVDTPIPDMGTIQDTAKFMNNADYLRNINTIHVSLKQLRGINVSDSKRNRLQLMKSYDTYLCRSAILHAIQNYIQMNGISRGSYLIMDSDGSVPAGIQLDHQYRFKFHGEHMADQIQQVKYIKNQWEIDWRKVRPIPNVERVFENLMVRSE